MSALISVEEAQARVLRLGRGRRSPKSGSGSQEAFGRVLAAIWPALRTQPPFVNSAMDGYALRAADTANAPRRSAWSARRRRDAPSTAGSARAKPCASSPAAPIPCGADAVVIQEDVRREADRITVSAFSAGRRHLRPAGLDFAEGELLLRAGRRLTARDVALAAAANHAALPVRRPPGSRSWPPATS